MLQREHSAILSTFIKLAIVIKIYVLFIFERPFYTGFTVVVYIVGVYSFVSFFLFFLCSSSVDTMNPKRSILADS